MKKEINIPSKIESISIVENLIDEISIELSLVADLYGNVLIGVIEAVTNAITHGNKLDETKFVSLLFTFTEPHLMIKISDEGEGFGLIISLIQQNLIMLKNQTVEVFF